MQFDGLPAAEQIALLMRRIYEHAMTTTSGGNLSARDSEGRIWISPGGVDKGTLKSADVVCVQPDGQTVGHHRPSLEYPFHKAVYEARPDIRALVHAHPADLVAFSIVRRIPDTHIIPQAQKVCGVVGHAGYALPGSEKLGRNIAEAFAAGADCVMLENHGVVCGGASLLEAYHRFETLDFCARVHVQGSRVGQVRPLTPEQIRTVEHPREPLREIPRRVPGAAEQELRRRLADTVHRAYRQHIMTSTEGTYSARLDEESFLITPSGVDRLYLEVGDLVRVSGDGRETGPVPSRAVLMHQTIYKQHPEIHAIVTAQPPAIMAFAVTGQVPSIRIIPESYFVLRDMPLLPFEACIDYRRISETISKNCPVLLLENDCVLAVGANVLQAFDRLEVAEFTARSILKARSLGELAAMNDEQIAEIARVFMA